MSITEKVQKDMITAMKARDKERTSALRMILSQLQAAEGPRDTGKVMSHVMAKAAGRADGRAVSAIVKNRLGG